MIGRRRWISSMNSTSPGSRLVRIAARSPVRCWSGGDAEGRSHLERDDVGERRLAEAGGAEQEDVVEALPPLARRADEDLQVVDDLALADVLLQPLGAERGVDAQILGIGCPGEDSFVGLHRAPFYPDRFPIPPKALTPARKRYSL